ncbi:MAG: hypothetical protein N2Z79_02005, partial [Candidatus Omnitrophica bacterium]|nr:hypothetical protein [Candidatus Omnitrophota bacterium]
FATHANLYNILGYILGIGPLFLTGSLYIYRIIKENKAEFYFLVIWLIGIIFLLCLPFVGIRMRTVEGLHIGLCILSTLDILADRKKGLA